MIPFVDLKAQYLSIKDEIHTAITSVVENCQFVLGPEVEAFEEEFAAYCQTTYAVGLNSGTSALHLALLTGGVKPGGDQRGRGLLEAGVEHLAAGGAEPVAP